MTSSPVKSSTSKYKDSFVLSTSNINNNSVITIDDHENDDPPEDSVNCSDNESTMQLPKCTRSKKQLSENQIKTTIKMTIMIKKRNQMINENSLIRS